MILTLTFVLFTLTMFGLFWGGSLVAQAYFYQQPADRLPLRAAVAALLVGLFTTFWVWVDRKNPDKYGTFFTFAGETTRDYSEFEAVRWQYDPVAKSIKKDAQGNPVEAIAKFKKAPGGKTPSFLEEKTNKKFEINDTSTMTAALVVNGDDGSPKRFNAEMKKDEKTGMMNYVSGVNERRFLEDKGNRYIKAEQPGVIYVPSGGVVAVALLLNFLLFVVWFAAFWPVLKFTWGHALGFAAVCGVLMMLVGMQLLFDLNRKSGHARVAAGISTLHRDLMG